MAKWEMNFNPRIDFRAQEIVSNIVEVEAFKRSVLMIPLPPKLRRKIDRINIVRQIRGTTGIEGNTLDEKQIEAVVDAAVASGQSPESLEEKEVLNAEKVHRFITEHADRKSTRLNSSH